MASLMRNALRACAPRTAFTPVRPTFAPVARPAAERGVLVVMAAEGKKDKKKTPSPEKQAELSQERRLLNRARKSACATRIKKVIKASEALIAAPPATEEEVKPLEKLIAEAYQQIDKAVVKGVLHQNTAARKKARCARYKRKVLVKAGLYTPA